MSQPNRTTLLLERERGVLHVRLNRPEKLNALDSAMFTALSEASAELAARTDVRAVVLSGSGRAFCAGLDLASMAGPDPSSGRLHDRSYGIANIFQNAAWGWRSAALAGCWRAWPERGSEPGGCRNCARRLAPSGWAWRY